MNTYLNKLLYTCEDILPKYVCEHIIDMFENNEHLHEPGRTGGVVNLEYRRVTALGLPKKDIDWYHVEQLLFFIVKSHFDKYLKTVNIYDYEGGHFILREFIIIKYEKKSDFYKSHNDFMIDHKNRYYRYATFIIYLNTVDEGGNTIFWDTHKEKPTCGKIIIFPSNWTFQHQGEMPISNNKYIICGWICMAFGKTRTI